MKYEVIPRPQQFLGYAERAYFTTDACQHCAARDDYLRVQRIQENARAAMERR